MPYDKQLVRDNIDAFLEQHENKELLRFTTVGSVDDGKSTLIGRLLYDTGEVYEDQLDAVKRATKDDNDGEVDLALITDGLRAEREQGITIDVAYRYFTTSKRKFIIADTPGHVQYTRNMATGASTADVAIILIDARYGVLPQSKRHASIAALLRIPNLLVAVNKLDLKEYSQEVYEEIKKDFLSFSVDLGFEEVKFFPVSALKGDNIVEESINTPWYDGPTILDYLESVPLVRGFDENNLCFPVQYVIRPDLNFRGFAGTVANGVLRKGYEIMTLPSGKRSRVKSIVTYDGELQKAFAPQSVTVTLEDEIDISRGDMIVYPQNNLHVTRKVRANMVWMSEEPLKVGTQYIIKHTTNIVNGAFTAVHNRVDMETLDNCDSDILELNDIGEATLALNKSIIADAYKNSRQAGAFIVIDRITNITVGAGMINDCGIDEQQDSRALAAGVDAEERAERFAQKPSLVWITGPSGSGKIVLARALERRLFDAGHMPFVLDPRQVPHEDTHSSGDRFDKVLDFVEVCKRTGMVVISAFSAPTRADRKKTRQRLNDDLVVVHTTADEEVRRSRIEFLGGNPDSATAEYEDPSHADLVLEVSEDSVEKDVDTIVELLRSRRILS